jgi:hypothetical protein
MQIRESPDLEVGAFFGGMPQRANATGGISGRPVDQMV